MPHYPKPFFKKSRGYWYLEVNRRQINLGPDREEAFRRYHEIMRQPQERKVAAHSLAGVIEAFLAWCQEQRAAATYEWYRFRLQAFYQWQKKHYPNVDTKILREFHIDEWLSTMNGLSSGSKRNYCRAIKAALRWAKRKGRIDFNPIAGMELPKAGKRETVISKPQFDEILSLVPDRAFRDLLIVTWETGCRPQESLIVEARHVDLTNSRWIFSESEEKTRRVFRAVYLPDQALEITRRLILKYPEGPLFRNSRGNPWTTDAVNCAFVRLQIKLGRRRLEAKEACKDKRRKLVYVDEAQVKELATDLRTRLKNADCRTEADLLHEARKRLNYKLAASAAPKYSLYVLRHSWATLALERGVDALTVAILMGHQDPSTLAKVYQHLSHNPRHLLDQAKRAAG